MGNDRRLEEGDGRGYFEKVWKLLNVIFWERVWERGYIQYSL